MDCLVDYFTSPTASLVIGANANSADGLARGVLPALSVIVALVSVRRVRERVEPNLLIGRITDEGTELSARHVLNNRIASVSPLLLSPPPRNLKCTLSLGCHGWGFVLGTRVHDLDRALSQGDGLLQRIPSRLESRWLLRSLREKASRVKAA